ncbi:MAG TPA: NmrA family transcriptional regulator [Actinophytocola sp.]|nr:NmrA family transcriptional regulator [Actinophytocola sp.]
MTETAHHRPTLVLGGTGKTGRRLVQRLTRRHIPVRIGSRSTGLPFHWDRPSTWGPVFQDVEAAYTYVPDLVVANPTDAIAEVVETALAAGTRRVVLLSGRGEERAEACEKILMSSGADWTVLRASFFNQNFSESYLVDAIRAGEVMLPAGDVGEPFSDTDDIADVAATVLTEDGHVGAIYELTGPRALTFAEATTTIAEATGRDIAYTRIPPGDFAAGLAAVGVPQHIIDFLVHLFDTVLDGRNAAVGDGVEQVLGRPARDFADYARVTTATGVWNPTDQPNPGSPR